MSHRKQKQSLLLKDVNTRAKDLQICLWFAEMKTAQEVADLVKENFNIPDYTRQRAYSFSKSLRWARLIRFLKAKFLKDLSAIPIANKAFRIKALQTVYKEALTESLKSRNQWGEVYELKLGAAIEAIKAAREEIEGEKGGKGISVITIIYGHRTSSNNSPLRTQAERGSLAAESISG